MISVEERKGKYFIRFKGRKNQFTEYINKIMTLPNKEWDLENKCWVIPTSSLVFLQNKFKNIEYLEEVEDINKKVITGYENMGQHMKLTPYDYQKEAIKFGLHNDSCLLIYPCGSGKTPIGIGIYDEAKRAKKIKGPGLIVVKASLKTQWSKEVSKFSDYNAHIIETTSDITASIKDKIKRRKQTLKKGTFRRKKLTEEQIEEIRQEIINLEKEMDIVFKEQFENVDFYIANYETLKEDAVKKQLRKKKIDFIFADEIHYVKNRDSDRSKALYEFCDVKMRIGATATPVKKNYEDVFGLFKFVQPTLFANFTSFANKYIKYCGPGRIAGFKNVDHLQKKIAPFVIVKDKSEISDQLPVTLAMQRYCDLYPAQQEASDNILEELSELKEKEFALRCACKTEAEVKSNPDIQKLEGQIMALQTFAQEIADSPELLNKTSSEMAKKYAIKDTKSSKLELMAELVEEIINSGEKVCIFTKFERMHDILAERISKIDKKIKIARVNGTMDDKVRYSEIYDKFRDNDEYKILLGTDAMAEGANLSKCQYLIEYDLAESYAIQTQRWGRLERADSIHQTVYIYQLICNDSWDEIQAKIVNKKEGYDAELFKSLGQK